MPAILPFSIPGNVLDSAGGTALPAEVLSPGVVCPVGQAPGAGTETIAGTFSSVLDSSSPVKPGAGADGGDLLVSERAVQASAGEIAPSEQTNETAALWVVSAVPAKKASPRDGENVESAGVSGLVIEAYEGRMCGKAGSRGDKTISESTADAGNEQLPVEGDVPGTVVYRSESAVPEEGIARLSEGKIGGAMPLTVDVDDSKNNSEPAVGSVRPLSGQKPARGRSRAATEDRTDGSISDKVDSTSNGAADAINAVAHGAGPVLAVADNVPACVTPGAPQAPRNTDECLGTTESPVMQSGFTAASDSQSGIAVAQDKKTQDSTSLRSETIPDAGTQEEVLPAKTVREGRSSPAAGTLRLADSSRREPESAPGKESVSLGAFAGMASDRVVAPASDRFARSGREYLDSDSPMGAPVAPLPVTGITSPAVSMDPKGVVERASEVVPKQTWSVETASETGNSPAPLSGAQPIYRVRSQVETTSVETASVASMKPSMGDPFVLSSLGVQDAAVVPTISFSPVEAGETVGLPGNTVGVTVLGSRGLPNTAIQEILVRSGFAVVPPAANTALGAAIQAATANPATVRVESPNGQILGESLVASQQPSALTAEAPLSWVRGRPNKEAISGESAAISFSSAAAQAPEDAATRQGSSDVGQAEDNRRENIAGATTPLGAVEGDIRRDGVQKKYKDVAGKEDKKQTAVIGTSFARSASVMQRDSQNPGIPSLWSEVREGSAVIRKTDANMHTPMTDSRGDSTTSRTLSVVREVIEHAQGTGRRTVELKLQLPEGESLSLQIQMRAGVAHTTFRTDSAELREALARDWHATMPGMLGGETPVKLAEPSFVLGSSGARQDTLDLSGQGQGQNRQQGSSEGFDASAREMLQSGTGSQLRRAHGTSHSSDLSKELSATSIRPDTSRHLHTFA